MNLLFTYELERRLRERNSKITVNAFGPGLITRTGLFKTKIHSSSKSLISP